MPVAQPFLNTPGQVGALAGYSDGLRMSYGLADLDREFRDRDLKNQSDTLRYEEDIANKPLREAERGVKMGLAGVDQSLINEGLVERSKRNEFALSDQKVASGQQAIDSQTRIERGEAVQEGIQILKNPALANSNAWSEYYNKMTTKHKMRGLSPDFRDPNNAAVLNAANQAFVNTRQHQGAMELGAQREAGNLAQEEARGRTARANAETIAAREGTPPTVDKKIHQEAQKEMAATGGVLRVEVIDAYRSAMDKKDNTAIAARAATIMTQLHREKTAINLVKYAADRGITIPDNSFSIDDLSVMLAEKELKERGMKDAWIELGSPKITTSDLAKVSTDYPKFAKTVLDSKRVTTTATPQAPAAPAAQPNASQVPAKASTVSPEVRRTAIAKLIAKYPQVPPAEIIAGYDKTHGISTPTQGSTQGVVDSHVPPPVQKPFNPSITNALDKFSYQDSGVD